ncbi:MAG: rhodanese-like domain-containing protein [bacterium]|nr:rhodanese-like domain-containing protein [bacterium]
MDISIPDYKDLRESGSPHELIDVREAFEWNEGHLDGARLIPLSELELQIKKQLPDQSMPIILYCRSGARSSRAVELLGTMGYINVYNLIGGYSMWSIDPDNR